MLLFMSRMVTEFHGNGKQGLEIAGNCRQLPFHWQLPAICPLRRALWEYTKDWPCMPSELGDIRRFQHHIKSSIRLVEFVCQEPRNLGSSPYALWAHGQRLIRFPPPSVDCKMGSEIPGISISTFQRGNEKQGSEIAGNCRQLPCRQLPSRFPQ